MDAATGQETQEKLAELRALRALELSKGKRVNIYTDFAYAHGIAHRWPTMDEELPNQLK